MKYIQVMYLNNYGGIFLENASKALLMAGAVLIGILVLSLIAYLFIYFGNQSKDFRDTIDQKQLTKFNAQYTIYDGKSNLTIYDVVTVINIAFENNMKHMLDSNYNTEYFISVKLDNVEKAKPDPTDNDTVKKHANVINEIIQENRDNKYRCSVGFYQNGKVSNVKFTKI